ncbi:hypothetical protein BSLG_003602 [Batrachochytrium salamandrivorans]|nr:hypothetical protein BSLG_003602 [Batrachochytrium salamandrivorans]
MPLLVRSAIAVRNCDQLLNSSLDALILPGGESTTITLVAHRNGMILLSDTARKEQRKAAKNSLAACMSQVQRNAFGHQLDSFMQAIDVPVLGSEPFQAVFIRAPLIAAVDIGDSTSDAHHK